MLLGRDVRNVEGCPHGKAWFGYERKNAATISKNYTDQRTYARTRVIGTEAGQRTNLSTDRPTNGILPKKCANGTIRSLASV